MTNPIQEKFLSARIYGVIKGNIGLEMDKTKPDYLQAQVISEKMRVKQLEAYFKTETQERDLEEEFVNVIEKKLLAQVNELVKKSGGIQLPIFIGQQFEAVS